MVQNLQDQSRFWLEAIKGKYQNHNDPQFLDRHFWTNYPLVILKWAASWLNQLNDLAPSKDSDQPGHPPSLIKSSLCSHWVAEDPSFLHADSEDSDQTGRMPRLIWVFAGRTCHFVGFVMRRLNYPLVILKYPVWSGSTLFAILSAFFDALLYIKPPCSNFRVITENFSGVWIFLSFTVCFVISQLKLNSHSLQMTTTLHRKGLVASWQNGMCAQSDHSLRCQHEESLGP